MSLSIQIPDFPSNITESEFIEGLGQLAKYSNFNY
jgi:hypothetical protein